MTWEVVLPAVLASVVHLSPQFNTFVPLFSDPPLGNACSYQGGTAKGIVWLRSVLARRFVITPVYLRWLSTCGRRTERSGSNSGSVGYW